MSGGVGLDLINHSNRSESAFHRDDITPMIVASWCERYIVESGALVGASYHFLP